MKDFLWIYIPRWQHQKHQFFFINVRFIYSIPITWGIQGYEASRNEHYWLILYDWDTEILHSSVEAMLGMKGYTSASTYVSLAPDVQKYEEHRYDKNHFKTINMSMSNNLVDYPN